MAEQMIKVDGKEIKATEMPKNCFMIHGEWYTEKGLPSRLSAYKHLWEKPATITETKKKSKPQTTPPLSQPVQDALTANIE
jgi:hypothetical protein